MKRQSQQSGFTAVELLITLFVAAAFLIAAYQLFNLVVKDGGSTRGESRAANVAYDYMRQYAATATTIPCTASAPLTGAPLTIDGLTSATMNVTITCLPNAISSISKVDVALTYNNPAQTVEYATYVSSSGTTGTPDVTNGLVAWWKLNGNANTSIGSPNGVITNATSTTNSAGQTDMAYAFNGTNATINTASTFGLGATNASISCWIYNPSATNHGLFVNVGITTGFGIGVGNTTTDTNGSKLVMLFNNVRWVPTSATVGTGWHHIVMVLDGAGTPTGYVDGISAGAFAGAGSGVPSNAITTIGGINNVPADNFNGSVDDVRLYNRALPLADILALYSAGAK